MMMNIFCSNEGMESRSSEHQCGAALVVRQVCFGRPRCILDGFVRIMSSVMMSLMQQLHTHSWLRC